ncbi:MULTISPECIES: DHA2 family efflux MFS transporter permease subunit [unclassified Paenibacillus]|uniref:DHA2 family efflux MFS transporter permease subunit n=1 Tax=unclassified Paenibacillus TaxID=185978 RepID=UPI000956F35A|nr:MULTISPECIES: DHA2 family efflux MFS transporter permease subunit [unclassified Paenibacillus]ASS68417.1 DHA2 family efflux MFS transporter permease subunit [Paenibacillus sp. RUD330]SIR32451.1 drug resistance transporter, EmrB/QacA subfamily [Paenibacillus sp. RU4X]SIR43771.1 drug resistance transporter, EmrB/QacA subfamily [Paenibacillus sp. RU4T]
MSAEAHVGTPLPVRSLLAPLIAIIVGLFMVILDTTAVNVAIPVLADDLHSPLSLIQWTITGYSLAQAVVIPMAGWFSDRFGAKPIFIVSIILFVAGSILCAFAGTAEQLIVFRIVQGLGGGMVVPIAFAMTYRISPPESVGKIMGMMGVPVLLAPALGPVVSGYLVDYVNWKWIFLINIPVGIVGVIMSVLYLPKLPKKASAPLDYAGIALAPFAFGGLSYGLSEAGEGWSSPRTIAGLTVGAVAMVLFAIVELRRKSEPLLELKVFRSVQFSRGIVVQWVMQFSMFGLIFAIPYFMQRLMGMSAFEAGLWTLPQALASAAMMPFSGRLFDRIGARPLVIGGLALLMVGAYLLSTIDPSDSPWLFLVPRALIGFGTGLSFIALNTHLIQTAPKELVGKVTSLTSAAQQVLGSFAIAGLTTLLVSRTNHYSRQGEAPIPDAMSHAFHNAYLLIAILAAAGLLLALTLKRPAKEQAAEPAVMMDAGI